MIGFRCFRNDDPPRLAEVWRTADLGPAAVQPMTPALLETSVLSKPVFDPQGLVVAFDAAEENVVGFAHAAFGPTVDQSALDTRVGTTLLIVVTPRADADAIGLGLLERCESYLIDRGATTLLGGGSAAMHGLYIGLYGGSDLPGILDSSPTMQRAFRRAGYVEHERIVVLRRQLAGFRPPVNRLQLAIRRSTSLVAIDEPPRRTWWEAVTTSGIALRRYELRTAGDEVLGTATYWDMQPLAASWGVSAWGLLEVGIAGSKRRQGLAHYLVAESMHDLAVRDRVALLETHVAAANVAASQLFAKLGFVAGESGIVFRRP